jgi:hypothetical protein
VALASARGEVDHVSQLATVLGEQAQPPALQRPHAVGDQRGLEIVAAHQHPATQLHHQREQQLAGLARATHPEAVHQIIDNQQPRRAGDASGEPDL